MSYNWHRQRYHLTYKGHLDRDDFLHFVDSLAAVKAFSFVHETSDAEHEYDHTHYLVWFAKQPNWRKANKLDYKTVHPHIQPINDDHHWSQTMDTYHHKAPIGDSLLQKTCTLVPWHDQVIARINECKSEHELLNLPGSMGSYVSQRIGWARGVLAAAHPPEEGEYTLESCAEYTGLTPYTDFSKTVVIMGPPGKGKTEFACAHFKHPLVVEDWDDLRSLDPGHHDGIVFDDCTFTDLAVNVQKHLTDVSKTRTIRCRYVNARIPKGMPRFVCSNEYPFVDDESLHSDAIRRRIQTATV